MMNKEATLLIVEDDQVDIMGLKRVLNKLRIANPVKVANDGIEALEILRGKNGNEKLDTPFIIMLDLNMPRMNGLEFLKELRKDPVHQNAVVFVMTTSSDEQDIYQAYQNNIAGYIIKSDAETTFTQALNLLEHYWKVVELPTNTAG